MKSKILILMIVGIVVTGCSPKGFQSQSALTQDSSNTLAGVGDGNSNVPPVNASLDSVDLKGQVQDSSGVLGFNNALAFDFDKTRGEFIIMVPMPSGMIFTPTGAFNNYPDIRFSPLFDASGKMKMAVRIPIKYVLRGINTINPTRLPSGESLPAMPAGKDELPSFALQFPQSGNVQLNLYVGINALGLYMSLPPSASLPIPFNITLPIKNKAKTVTSGYLTYVTAKNGYDSGIFVSTIIPPSIARILEDNFHLD